MFLKQLCLDSMIGSWDFNNGFLVGNYAYVENMGSIGPNLGQNNSRFISFSLNLTIWLNKQRRFQARRVFREDVSQVSRHASDKICEQPKSPWMRISNLG